MLLQPYLSAPSPCRRQTDFRRSQGMVGSRSGGSSLGCPSAQLFPQALPQVGQQQQGAWLACQACTTAPNTTSMP